MKGCVVGPGENPLRRGEVAIRVTPRKGESIADAFIRTAIAARGGYQNLPEGLRPGSIVGGKK